MMSEIPTEPTVRMALLANRMKNFSPASATLKLASVNDGGRPHLFARYSALVLKAETVMKYTGNRDNTVAATTDT